MKKIILVFILGSLLSCDIGSDDDSLNFAREIISIDSVDIPSEFVFGDTVEITVNYTRPNECYQFSSFIFQSDGNTRTVAVVDDVLLNVECSQNTVDASVSFDFFVTSNETYIFQFFQGTSNTGEDQYLIVEVPVVQ